VLKVYNTPGIHVPDRSEGLRVYPWEEAYPAVPEASLSFPSGGHFEGSDTV
jgi:hypothetical protein